MKRRAVELNEGAVPTALSASAPSPSSPPFPHLPNPIASVPPIFQRPPTTFPPAPHLRVPQPPNSIFLTSHYRSLGVLRPSLLPVALSSSCPPYHLSSTHLLHSLHTTSITSLALESVECRYLLSADTHGLIALYDTLTPLLPHPTHTPSPTPRPTPTPTPPLSTSSLTTHRGHGSSINALCWYPVDTGMFMAGGTDGLLHTFDTNTFTSTHHFTLRNASINAVAMSGVSAAHALVAVASSDPHVRLCDLTSGGFAHTLIGHGGEVTTVAWTPFSEFLLVTGSFDRVRHGERGGGGAMGEQYTASNEGSR